MGRARMMLSRFDNYRTIEIWTLRGHDNVVLINDKNINKKIPHYRIIFTKNKSRAGKEYYLPYQAIKKSKKEWHKAKSGEDILRYAVPESRLEDLTINKKDIRLLI